MAVHPENRALVVVPTYDEADNIGELLDRLHLAAPDVQVLVVDDASPDGTAHLVRERAARTSGLHLLERASKDGLGAAYRAGFRWALDRDYDVIAQMDADLSHPPESLARLIGALAGAPDTPLAAADLAIGSRYVPGGSVADWSPLRRQLSRFGNLWVRHVLDLHVADSTAGFRAYTREALLRVGAADTTSDGYCFQIENTWRAQRRGLRVVEVPIAFTDRASGSSKMSIGIAAEALGRSLQWRWGELVARPEGVGTDVVAPP
ncbi:polyprenol monophosphomannose synthase [Nocardioides sp.]|uniref:polyprenol monophosphomannose synthase n=1 Tax=Nocardioides sp. TaxID=35761 RepID=UPI00261BAFB8|nr:polyprenol monophosphomannose synthase [Nocardioides sp.]